MACPAARSPPRRLATMGGTRRAVVAIIDLIGLWFIARISQLCPASTSARDRGGRGRLLPTAAGAGASTGWWKSRPRTPGAAAAGHRSQRSLPRGGDPVQPMEEHAGTSTWADPRRPRHAGERMDRAACSEGARQRRVGMRQRRADATLEYCSERSNADREAADTERVADSRCHPGSRRHHHPEGDPCDRGVADADSEPDEQHPW